MKHLFFSLLFFTTVCSGYAQQKPTYVIVHGAWGGSWAFKKVDSLLTNAGCIVYRPALTGQGERVHLASPEIDLNTHIKDVVSTLIFEQLNDVILVGHSYGGMVITGVADSVPERIKQLVYLDAFVPNDKENVVTARADGKAGPAPASANGFMVPAWTKQSDPFPKDVPQSVKTFTTPVSWKNLKAKALPATYILTVDEGKKAEEDFFYYFSERARKRNWKVIEMVADHNPQWSKPLEFSEILIDLTTP